MPTDQELIKIVRRSVSLSIRKRNFMHFFHFGMNTYTNREWGDGTEGPGVFDPQDLTPGNGYRR